MNNDKLPPLRLDEAKKQFPVIGDWLTELRWAYSLGAQRALEAQAQQAEPQWAPVESAPKDGTTVLLLEKWESEPFVGYWRAFRGSGK